MIFDKFPPFLFYCGAFVGRSCLNSAPRLLIIMRKCPAILPDGEGSEEFKTTNK